MFKKKPILKTLIKNKNYVAFSIILFLITFVIYTYYYDILIPGLPNGSYRHAIGQYFAIPAFLLAGGQVMLAGVIIFVAANTYKNNQDFEKSLLISSVLVLMFAMTYVMFPMYGPFYYIVFAVGGPPYVLVVELVWSIAMLVVATNMINKLHKIGKLNALITAFVTLVFIMVAAS